MRQYDDVEDDGFITVVGLSPAPEASVSDRCADCHQFIEADGSGHLSWCPFFGRTTGPRLQARARHPSTSIGE